MYNLNGGGIGGIDYSYLLIGGRENYHFSTSRKFDPYAGITLGYNYVSFTNNSQNKTLNIAPVSYLLYGAQLGANYYFLGNFGAWAEIGYGIGIINFGLAYNF